MTEDFVLSQVWCETAGRWILLRSSNLSNKAQELHYKDYYNIRMVLETLSRAHFLSSKIVKAAACQGPATVSFICCRSGSLVRGVPCTL